MDAGGGVRTIVIQVALYGDIWWWSYHDSLLEEIRRFRPLAF
jgi:hypothetical protein